MNEFPFPEHESSEPVDWGKFAPLGDADGQQTPSSPDKDEFYNPTLFEKVRNVGRAAANDFRGTTWKGKIALGSMVGMVGYEYGPGNETAVPIVAGQALDMANGVGGVALTGLIAGGFVAVQQLSSGFLARRTAENFPNVSQVMYRNLNSQESEELKYKPFNSLPAAKKYFYAYFFGTSFTVTREAMVTGDINQDKLKRTSRLSTAYTAGTVSVMAATVDTVNQVWPDNDFVQTGVDFVKNPLVWLTIGFGTIGYQGLKPKVSNWIKAATKKHKEGRQKGQD